MSEEINLRINANTKEAVNNVDNLDKSLDKVTKSTEKQATSNASLGVAFAKMSILINVAEQAFAKVSQTLQEGVKLYTDREAGLGRLERSYKRLGQSTEDYNKTISRAEEVNKTYGVSIDDQINGLQRLVEASGSAMLAEQDLQLAMNISAANNTDLTSAIELLRKARKGELEEIKNLDGVNKDLATSLNGLTDTSAKVKIAFELLNDTYRNAQKETAGTSEKIAVLDQSFVELKIKLGETSLEAIKVLETFGKFSGIIKEGGDALSPFTEKLEEAQQILKGMNNFDATILFDNISLWESPTNNLAKALKAMGDEADAAQKKAEGALIDTSGLLDYVNNPTEGDAERKIRIQKMVEANRKAWMDAIPKDKPKTSGSKPKALDDGEFLDSLGPAKGEEAREMAKKLDDEDIAAKKAKADAELKIQQDLDKAFADLRKRNADDADKINKEMVAKNVEAQKKKTDAIRAGADAAVTFAEVAGAGEAELAVMKAAIETAESIAAFARYDFGGGVGHAAAAVAFAAAAAKGGSSVGSGGSSGGAAKQSQAAMQSERIEAQKDNTMALKEAFADALKEANKEGQNVTYIINQSGVYVGTDNVAMSKLREEIDGTKRLQF